MALASNSGKKAAWYDHRRGIGDAQSSVDSFTSNPDFQALEEALRRASQNLMPATIEEVVQVAAEAFAYPFGARQASRCLCLLGRYRVIGGIVEPINGSG